MSEDVMRRVSAAIDALAADATAPRTKRQIEHLSGLGHDVVARAFRQDADEQGHPYRLTPRFADLTGATGRRSPVEQERHQHKQKITELGHEIRDLNRQLDRYAMCLFAQSLQDMPEAEAIGSDVVAIRRHHRQRL